MRRGQNDTDRLSAVSSPGPSAEYEDASDFVSGMVLTNAATRRTCRNCVKNGPKAGRCSVASVFCVVQPLVAMRMRPFKPGSAAWLTRYSTKAGGGTVHATVFPARPDAGPWQGRFTFAPSDGRCLLRLESLAGARAACLRGGRGDIPFFMGLHAPPCRVTDLAEARCGEGPAASFRGEGEGSAQGWPLTETPEIWPGGLCSVATGVVTLTLHHGPALVAIVTCREANEDLPPWVVASPSV